MREIAPRITYSPEGILELHRTVDEETRENSSFLNRRIEMVSNNPGYEVVEDGSEITVRVNIKEELGEADSYFQNPQADKIIENLNIFTYFDYTDKRDGVFSIDSWYKNGADGKIYPQFQRWLNNGGLSDEVARECIRAMVLPFDKATKAEVEKDYTYASQSNSSVAESHILRVVSRREEFRISKFVLDQEIPGYRNGSVEWNWIDITTIGGCACWGPSGEERDSVMITPDFNHLYIMKPHNVDTAVQSLSLVLGMASLAYRAALYEGTEDILANATFSERIF